MANPPLLSLSNGALGKDLPPHNGVLGTEDPHAGSRMVRVFAMLHGTRAEYEIAF